MAVLDRTSSGSASDAYIQRDTMSDDRKRQQSPSASDYWKVLDPYVTTIFVLILNFLVPTLSSHTHSGHGRPAVN